MSDNPPAGKQADNALDATQVAVYLQQNPDFFHDQLGILENLSIPHPSGNAISLLSKQLELFRSKNQALEEKLTALIDIAKENDISINRMHELTLALMEAKTIEDVVANLEKVLADCFLTDFVALRVINDSNDEAGNPFFIDRKDDNLQHFSAELMSNKPNCGPPTLTQARFLFGQQAPEVKSCAIIPMIFTELEGLIVIGSRDESRFHYSLGDLFLTQMGEVIGTRLISVLACER